MEEERARGSQFKRGSTTSRNSIQGQEGLSRRGSGRSASTLRDDPVGAVLDWQPRENDAQRGWWCTQQPVPAQQMAAVRVPGSPDSISFSSPEHKAFYDVMQLLQSIRSDNLKGLEQALTEQKKALRSEIEQVAKQVKNLHEKIQEASQKTDRIPTTAIMEEMMNKNLMEIEKLVKKRGANKNPLVEIGKSGETAKAASGVVAGRIVDDGDYKLIDEDNEMGFAPVNSLFSQDYNEGAMPRALGMGTNMWPSEGEEKKPKKERRPSVSSTKSDGSTKGDKRFAGKRKSKKLKLDRDDYDTSLFLISDKIETEQLVEQAIANLNLSEEWQRKIAPDTNSRIVGCIRSKCFNWIVNLMIMLNVLCVAIQSEHAVSQARKGEQSSAFYSLIDVVFCMFFACEIILRLMGDRVIFFVGPDMRWNITDLCFVLLDIVNQIFYLAFSGQDKYVSTFRTGAKMVRLVRTARALRMFRIVRSSNRARLLLEESVASASLGFWLCVVLLVVFTFFGLFFMQASADVLLAENVNLSLESSILQHFGTSPEAVFSLFSSVSGGRAWTVIFDELVQVDSVYGIIFVLFVFFFIVLFFNVVTGVFVDSAYRRSKQHEMENKSAEADRTRNLLEKAELDDIQGFVSKHEFLNFLSSPYGKDQLMSLGLESAEALGIYDLLDKNGKQRVHIGDLSSACARFTHPPRSVDHVAVLLVMKKLREEQKKFLETFQARMDKFENKEDAATNSMALLENMADKFEEFDRRLSLGSQETD